MKGQVVVLKKEAANEAELVKMNGLRSEPVCSLGLPARIPSSVPFLSFFFFFNIYLFLGQGETEHERGRGRERGRHRIGNRLQAPSHQPRARGGA